MRSKNATRARPQRDPSLAGLCNAIIEAGLLMAVVITPLYFNPRTQHTFEPDKAALLRSVVLIALLAWLIKNGKGKGENGRGNPFSILQSPFSIFHSPFSIFRPPLVLPALFLLTAYLIGTATSVLPRVSFWGSYERAQGLYTFLAYLGFFCLARQVLRMPGRRQLWLDAVLLVSAPISVYAVLQHFGLDPVSFRTGGAAVTARALSTLGNPIFLGAYLIMVVPLTSLRMYQVWQPAPNGTARRELAGLFGALLVLQLAALFFAQSRGPTLGLIGGLGLGVLLWAARRRARWLLVVSGLIAILGILMIGLLPAMGPQMARLGRLGQLVDPASRTGQQRLLVWEGVVNLVTADPARASIGYGPETLRDMIGPHMPPRIASLKPNRDFDRAHNAILDVWATTGLLGVGAYLLIVAAVFYYGVQRLGLVSDAAERRRFLVLAVAGVLVGGLGSWFGVGRPWIGVGLPLGLLAGVSIFIVWQGLRADRRPLQWSGDELMVVALLAAMAAHVVETLVGIAIVATYTLFWIYAALIAGPATDAEEETKRKKERRKKGDKDGGESPPFSPFPLSPYHLIGSSPPLPCSVWALITGITLALFSFPLLTAGQARGGMAWGVTASVTLLYGLLRLLLGRPDADELVLRYMGIAVGAVLAFVLITWLPWPPLDITHSTVATFVYTVLALLSLAVARFGLDHLRAVHLSSVGGRGAVYGLLAIATGVAVWVSNVRPIRADVFYKEGLGLSSAGDLQSAVRTLETSVALNPREARYHSGLGAAHAQLAQASEEPDVGEAWLSKAEGHLQKAQALDPYRADHLRNLGLLYRIWARVGSVDQRETRYSKALDFYARAAARNPVSVQVQIEWAAIYAELGRWEEAAEHYRASIQLNDGFVDAHLGLGDAYLHLGEYAKAARAYQSALALDDTRVLQTKQRAVQQQPDDPVAHQSMALVYAQLDRMDAAQAEAQRAQELMDEPAPAWNRFVTTLVR